jgi:16S rRNA (cytidine1402-2'-O)-methyltransferase
LNSSEPRAGKGILYLIPVALGAEDAGARLPPATLEAARALRSFIAEDAKSARAFLKSIHHPGPLQELRIQLLNEHTPERDLDSLLAPLLSGQDRGLVSEAGCPAVADPGAELVRRAHEAGIRVLPLVGPSSILLALMASGLNGQRFAFRGYLPVEKGQRARAIRDLEARAQDETQIFIETPYRTAALLHALLEHCRGDTQLCIALDLTLPTESVLTRPVSEWKKKPPVVDRRLAVFLLYRGPR